METHLKRNKMKQTSIEWLVQETPNMHWEDAYWADLFEQAKEMHKQEIEDAYKKGQESTYKIT